jgi:uncharacterized protein YyaL (SSP411 family)
LIEAMQTRFRPGDFDLALALADQLLDRFEDRDRGGFWFTSHDHERLYHRTKPLHDNATPSGNGIAAQSLIVLGHLAAVPRYVDAAERALKLFAPALAESGGSETTLLVALEQVQSAPTTVVLSGDASQARQWQRELERTYRPDVVIVDGAASPLPEALRKGAPPAAGVAAFVCRGTHCLPPLADLPSVERELA